MSCVGSLTGSRQPLLFTARGSRDGYGAADMLVSLVWLSGSFRDGLPALCATV
nr:MAG TPA: hypothetical protein [Caudoviricetes sp.]